MTILKFIKHILILLWTKILHIKQISLNMTDLLQKQILESCKLALPEGLKDLMSDISREVR